MESNNKKYYTILAEYFSAQPLYLDEVEKKKPNTRKLVEQPWQQTKSELLKVDPQDNSSDNIQNNLNKTLTDPTFWESKSCVLGIDNLIEDFRFANETAKRMESQSNDLILIFKSFLSLERILWAEAPVLRKYPELIIQQAWNKLFWMRDIPVDVRTRFKKFFEEKRSNNQLLLLGLVPEGRKTDVPLQTFNLDERPVALTMCTKGIVTFDRLGHWSLFDSRSLILRQGDIAHEVIKQVCFRGDTCVVNSGQVITIWKQWPEGIPFKFKTGWAIVEIDLSETGHLLVLGDGGQWVVYETKELKPFRIHEGKINENITAGSLSSDSSKWVIGTENGNVWICNEEKIVCIAQSKSSVRSVKTAFNDDINILLTEDGILQILNNDGILLFQEARQIIINSINLSCAGDSFFAVTASGECLRIYKENESWKSGIIFRIPYFLIWVGQFSSEGPIVVLDDSGTFRLINIEDNYFNKALSDSDYSNDIVTGIIPLSDESSLIAYTSGKLCRFQPGEEPVTTDLRDDGLPIKDIHYLNSQNALIVYHQRIHSYLALLEFDSKIRSLESIGPLETQEYFSMTLTYTHASPNGKYFLTCSRNHEGKNQTKIEIYKTIKWKKQKEKWVQGSMVKAVIDDFGTIAYFDEENFSVLKLLGLNNELIKAYRLAGGIPVAFNNEGQRLLVIDDRSTAWLCFAPWGENNILQLYHHVVVGSIDRDGKIIVLADEYGSIHVLNIDEEPKLVARTVARFPLGWIPSFCYVINQRSEIYLAGRAGFQILKWS